MPGEACGLGITIYPEDSEGSPHQLMLRFVCSVVSGLSLYAASVSCAIPGSAWNLDRKCGAPMLAIPQQ